MSGNGNSVTNAICRSIVNRIAAVITIISTSVQKSSRLTERNVQMRSVSLPTREIKSPVRLPPKNSSDSRCRCAYVSLRRSALICSLTRARTYVLAQLNSQASTAAPNRCGQVPWHDIEIDRQSVLARNQNVVQQQDREIRRHQSGRGAGEREREAENNHCGMRPGEATKPP